MNKELLKIAIAEPSVIIRSGITVVLKRIPGFRIQPVEITSINTLNSYLHLHKPDILIINPAFWGNLDITKLKEETENPKLICLALLSSVIDLNLLRSYNDTISLYDNVDQLKEKLDKLFDSLEELSDETNSLSQREKEIISCVVKGLTNKEIAQELFLSTHTVISHRRNITRKLEIHSTAGLTIYAIVNKLVELDEIKKNISL
ncbi:LuxR C-terminal-related transcriptional regulator [uncultured Bacteroides sp.]|uniref:response regulator transcription factor n=1 Tax=uncultured Bacteroides sp. TaxID=162156 RepID=UPI002AAB62E2|nr:LuxR C-terminal-related transcriptional regulator [uncultured Bacteroides sp.]